MISIRRGVAIGAVVALAVGIAGPAVAAPSPAATPTSTLAKQAPLANPDKVLGDDWRKSSDVLITGAGDTDGYHLYIAREKDAFAWSTLATLRSPALDVGPWGGSVCLTGSGRYAVAVFAPKMAANRPSALQAGAFAAVVDTTTGKAVHVATGVQYSYYNPACGPGDRALLVRGIGGDLDDPRTDLLTVDAAAGRVTGTRRIDAQVSNPAPGPDGDYGIVGGKLVKIGAKGGLTELATPHGRPYGVRATAGHGIDVISVSGETAVAERYRGGELTTTATGPSDRMELFGLSGGRSALVGEVNLSGGAHPGLTAIPASRRVSGVSAEGHLVAEEVYSQQTAESVSEPLVAADPSHAGRAYVAVRPVKATVTTTAVITTTEATTLDAEATEQSSAEVSVTAASSITTPKCAVPRNDPTVQPLQPSPNQVEWAVDLAVHDALYVSRPANYLKTGLPSYTPQSMFERHDVSGGGTVPANLVLAILAQETNLSQASWHGVPGDTANPLLPLYYGSYSIDEIDYTKADCGYGIGQVTTGMSVGETTYSENQRKAIAVDYAANIAASLNILIDKWNQMAAEPSTVRSQVNDGDARNIENWFLAVWAYNSGFYTYANRSANNGRYGVGWLNNPANSTYKANRDGFMRDTLADAETPSLWSYPERIMGWVETPQWKGSEQAYSEPVFGENGPTFYRVDWHDSAIFWHDGVSLPGLYTFCSVEVNSCSEAMNGCPSVSSACWWHGYATIGDCENNECSTEYQKYNESADEPELIRIYDRACTDFDSSAIDERSLTQSSHMIYTLNDPGQYALGCGDMGDQGGKFTLRGGDPAGATDDSYYAPIDLHQVGAGYKGHIWFTHGYSDTRLLKHKIVGTWAPELRLESGETARYDILVHLPSHGATWENATYYVQRGVDGGTPLSTETCVLDQDNSLDDDGEDEWAWIGNYELGVGARLQLNNEGAPEDADVGWDAAVFVPTGDRDDDDADCGDRY
ncbi:hypothetical protein [Actinoplanes sp. NPDC051851]|uniref:hypothetical protein n=1 Tax=Actinoplanes sp. NPDC051851 TaxID=3154753 RepID=UPI003427D225